MVKEAKLALCMICKDDSEAEIFDRCLDSFGKSYDYLYVAVTGTSGEHQKIHDIVKKYGGVSISTTPETHPKIYTQREDGTWFFSNFAEARNVSFDMVDKPVDFIFWADSDDICSNWTEIRSTASRAIELKLDMVYFVYWYAVKTNEQGEVTEVIVDQIRERLLKPGAFKWVSRLHEVCVPKETGFKPRNSVYELNPDKGQLCVWVHTADYTEGSTAHKKLTDRNAEILEIQVVEENYKDPRTLFYLGKTCFDVGTPEKIERAKSLFTRYLNMSGWDAERANAREFLGLIAGRAGNYRECAKIYLEAITEYPMNHLAYLRLAEAYLNMGMVSFAKHWLGVALRMDKPTATETVGNPFEIKLVAIQLNYRIAQAENNLVEMETWAKERQKIMGGKDDGLLAEVMDAKALNTAAISVFNLSKWLKDNGHADKITTLIDTLPSKVVNQPYLSILYKNIVPPRVWGDKEIAYYATAGIEEWTPENIDKGGIGGSETAVIRLAQEWTKLGYKVTVFNDCGSKEGVYGGVTYTPHYKMNWNDNFNILILWRNPNLLDQDIKAKKIFYDAHDIESQTVWTGDRMNKVDKVFFKSKYHRSNLPDLPDTKAEVIGNGVVVE